MYLQSVCFDMRYIQGKLEIALHRKKIDQSALFSDIVCDVSI